VKIYLDVCCLQRPFDDQREPRVHLEAEAVKIILAGAEAHEHAWISSEVVDYEIGQNPDRDRALKATLLAAYASEKITLEANEVARAGELELLGFGTFDALHLACAESGGVEVFLTTDDKLLKWGQRLADELQVRVINPLEWLQEI